MSYISDLKEVWTSHKLAISNLPALIDYTNALHVKLILHQIIQTLINKTKIEEKLNYYERLKHFIKKQCNDYTSSPREMIKSLLEHNKRFIHLDRIIIKDNIRQEYLINCPKQIKSATI